MAEIRANYVIKGWTANQLALRAPQVINAYRDVLLAQFKEEIEAVQFDWPRTTVRYGKYRAAKSDRQRNKVLKAQGGQKGVVVGSPRNIVDSGNFLRSTEVSYPNPTTLRFIWNAKSDKGFMYAGLILTGYTTSKGTPMPPRNWIKPALEKYPLDEFFIKEWRRLARSRV